MWYATQEDYLKKKKEKTILMQLPLLWVVAIIWNSEYNLYFLQLSVDKIKRRLGVFFKKYCMMISNQELLFELGSIS